MTKDDIEMVVRLSVALLAGAMVGYERSYHGRPAGLRTHALVCTASSLLMLVTVYTRPIGSGRPQIRSGSILQKWLRVS